MVLQLNSNYVQSLVSHAWWMIACQKAPRMQQETPSSALKHRKIVVYRGSAVDPSGSYRPLAGMEGVGSPKTPLLLLLAFWASQCDHSRLAEPLCDKILHTPLV